jgi:DNA-binding transcriptional LysR family regulator
MKPSQAEPVRPAWTDAQAPQGLELRHLRYLVAVADAGTFTRAAEQLFIAQPTLSQQIGRLEQLVGTPLLRRRRDGVRLTTAGAVLLDVSRDVLSLVDHGVSRTRQAAGLGRQLLRVVMPRNLPEALMVKTATLLRSATTAADVDLIWMETPLDAEFSLIRQHHADAGLGWLTAGPDALPAPLEAMTLGEFEPDLWIPASHPAVGRGTISLAETASLQLIYGPRRAGPGTYDRWLDVLRTVDPHFAFTDSPFRHSLPVALAFAATADPPAAVLTGCTAITGTSPGVIRRLRPADTGDMVRVSIAGRPLTATAALVWNGDLPRPLQQILFDTADGATPSAPAPCPALADHKPA